MGPCEYLEKHNILFQKNKDTSRISSIKAGGAANLFIIPKDEGELILAVKILLYFGMRFKVIGACTNTAFYDDGYSGAVISTSGINGCSVNENSIELGCGVSFSAISKLLARRDAYISSELTGIPGSIGGMVRSNAGAYGAELGDFFKSGRFLDISSMKEFELNCSDMNFGYRKSILQKGGAILLSAKFALLHKNSRDIFTEINSFALLRREKQPSNPSLGSFFKRSGSYAVSKMIDEAGLRGYRIGDAAVSEKHAGFIVNLGCATVEDIDSVAKHVENVIYKQYDIKIEREVELIR